MKIIIMISGRGSNMKALIKNGIKPISVMSDNRDAEGLCFAKTLGIDCFAAESKYIWMILPTMEPDLILLAGFMKILPKHITRQFTVLNIHPSLLPKHKGLHVHEKAIESGDEYSGCTIHLVDEKVDNGKIITQRIIQILDQDAKSLADSILEKEHEAYTKAVKIMLNKKPYKHGNVYDNIEKLSRLIIEAEPGYLYWENETLNFAKSAPEFPCIAVTPDDDLDIILKRLNNLVEF